MRCLDSSCVYVLLYWDVNQSGPGLFPGFNSLITACISATVLGSSRLPISSVLRAGILLYFRNSWIVTSFVCVMCGRLCWDSRS